MNKTEIDLFCFELFVGPLVWASSSMLFASVGLPASLWLLWVLIQRQRNGFSMVDVYMVNLTVMDLVFHIMLIPIIINYFFWYNYVYWHVTDYFFSLNVCGRPLFLAFICVDCYIAVVHPVTYMKIKHSRYRLIVSALVWTLTLAYGVIFIEAYQPLFSHVTLILFAFCLTTIIFCDVTILCTLRKPDPSGKIDVHPQKQRALQTITNSLIMIIVSYLPPTVVFGFSGLLDTVVPKQVMFCSVVVPTYITPTFGSTVMAILHLHNLGKLRDLKTLSFGCARSS